MRTQNMLGLSAALIKTHFKVDTLPLVASRRYIQTNIKHGSVPIEHRCSESGPVHATGYDDTLNLYLWNSLSVC